METAQSPGESCLLLALAMSQTRHHRAHALGRTLHSCTLVCLVSGTQCNDRHYYSTARFTCNVHVKITACPRRRPCSA